MAEADPVARIRELGLEAPWEYEFVQAFIRSYLCADTHCREQARRALPGLQQEVALHWAIRLPLRRN